MKIMRVGRDIDTWGLPIILALLNLLIIIIGFDIGVEWGDKVLKGKEIFGVAVIVFVVSLFILLSLKDVSCFIICEEEQITLRTPFRVLQTYSRQELKILFASRAIKVKTGWANCPCLAIGSILPATSALSKANYREMEKGYFLFMLNKKKLKSLFDWWQKEIELPNKEEWFESCKKWWSLYKSDVKVLEKYYKMIEDYNQSLQEKKDAQN